MQFLYRAAICEQRREVEFLVRESGGLLCKMDEQLLPVLSGRGMMRSLMGSIDGARPLLFRRARWSRLGNWLMFPAYSTHRDRSFRLIVTA